MSNTSLKLSMYSANEAQISVNGECPSAENSRRCAVVSNKKRKKIANRKDKQMQSAVGKKLKFKIKAVQSNL